MRLVVSGALSFFRLIRDPDDRRITGWAHWTQELTGGPKSVHGRPVTVQANPEALAALLWELAHSSGWTRIMREVASNAGMTRGDAQVLAVDTFRPKKGGRSC